jgi:molecular chaperone HscB
MSAPEYFELFGLEPKLCLDVRDLEQRFYALSRKVHPDRFLRATPAEREQSNQASALLNDAYRTLRNPVTRAEYMLKRSGLEAAESKQAPPELLERVFELNELLEEVASGGEEARPRLDAARRRLRGLLGEADAMLESLSERYDARDGAAAGEIRAVLIRRRYIANLLAQADRVLVS